MFLVGSGRLIGETPVGKGDIEGFGGRLVGVENGLGAPVRGGATVQDIGAGGAVLVGVWMTSVESGLVAEGLGVSVGVDVAVPVPGVLGWEQAVTRRIRVTTRTLRGVNIF